MRTHPPRLVVEARNHGDYNVEELKYFSTVWRWSVPCVILDIIRRNGGLSGADQAFCSRTAVHQGTICHCPRRNPLSWLHAGWSCRKAKLINTKGESAEEMGRDGCCRGIVRERRREGYPQGCERTTVSHCHWLPATGLLCAYQSPWISSWLNNNLMLPQPFLGATGFAAALDETNSTRTIRFYCTLQCPSVWKTLRPCDMR